jgi:SpoVK/Ycf46/Vps4 family AAA+-type ATPase
MIDAVSPCVVLIDEVEKALAGLESSGATDSGVTSRFIGSFLYYMQEKKSQSFFVCTSNDITKLPPELTRKGRFDEIWYVGLPSQEDIKSIIKIHLKKVGRDPKKFNIQKIAAKMVHFTGAEVENCIKEALYNAFFEDREITTEDIINVAKNTVPIVQTRSEEIQALEKWAKDRARFASDKAKLKPVQVKGKGWIR